MLDSLRVEHVTDCFMFSIETPVPFQGGGKLARSASYSPHDPPSILDQHEWAAGVYDFSRSEVPLRPGLDYFNCGLLVREDADWLLVRRSRWHKDCPFGMNDVLAVKLDCGTEIGSPAVALNAPTYYAGEHFEDPRGLRHDGRTFVSACNFVWAPNYSGAHQVILECDDNWKVKQRLDPRFGRNGGHCYNNAGNEKNWLWFVHDDKPHLLYQAFPHTVAEFDWKFQHSKTWETKPQRMIWQWGTIRGGTPPILVEGAYWTFYHSSVDYAPAPIGGGVRRYHMGAYRFEAKPPFRITGYTPEPLLSGSCHDRWNEGKPFVVFPCGAVHRNGEWFVTLGVNDLDCAWIFIPHQALAQRIKTL